MMIVIEALLSRLGREAEAERRLLTSAAIINAAIRIVRDSAPGNGKYIEYWVEQAKANMAFLNHAPLPDDGPYTDKLAESDRLLKVAREAIGKAPHHSHCPALGEWPKFVRNDAKCKCWKAKVLVEIAPAAPEVEKP